MKVINLLGGPGSRKSTALHGVMFELKRRGLKAEQAPETVKLPVYKGHLPELQERQEAIFADQHEFLSAYRKSRDVDFVVTDAPLIMTPIYVQDHMIGGEYLRKLAIATFLDYDNINFLLERPDEYQPLGRAHTQEEAIDLDITLKNLLDSLNIPYYTIIPENDFHIEIYNHILKEI